MKILFIVPSYKPAYVYGGPIESVAKLCEGLARRGHVVDVYTTTANGGGELNVCQGRKTDVDGVAVTYFRRITGDHTHISPALWKRLRSTVHTYDVVHIQSWWSILVIVSAMICHKRNARVIVSPRGMLSSYVMNSGNARLKWLIHNSIGRRALGKSFFHATAASEYDECVGLIKNWEGYVLPNILSLPDLPVEKTVNTVFTLIYMSRIHPKKNLEVVFRAISKLRMNVVLKVAGSGDAAYIDSLKALAHSLNIEDKIQWTGWMDRDQKFSALMQADLFILISRNENFANVVVESLHMGTPVLISREVALSEFVGKHDLGWLSSLDEENVTKKIEEAYTNRDKRSRIESNARASIARAFSEQTLIKQYEKKYETIIS